MEEDQKSSSLHPKDFIKYNHLRSLFIPKFSHKNTHSLHFKISLLMLNRNCINIVIS